MQRLFLDYEKELKRSQLPASSEETISLNCKLLEEDEGDNTKDGKKERRKRNKKAKRNVRKTTHESNAMNSSLSISTLSLQFSPKFKKAEEQAIATKLRKQVVQLVEADDVEGLKTFFTTEDNFASLNGSDGQSQKLTVESPQMSDPRSSMTLLHLALEENKTKVAEYLIDTCSFEYVLQTYTNLECQIPPSCKSCLHILAEQGNAELIEKFLVKLKSNYVETNPESLNLYDSLNKQRPGNNAKSFTELHAVVKVKGVKRRMAAVHLAVIHGHHNLIKLLKKHDIDLDARDSRKETPLMWAIQSGNMDCFQELLQFGVNVSYQNQFDCSPLHLAVSCGQLEMAEHLIGHESTDLNKERIKNPRWVVEMVASQNDARLMKKLMEPKIRVKIKEENIKEALFIAAKEGYDEIIGEILKDQSKLVNATDDFGNTPVMVAAENEKITSVKYLVDQHSADLTIKNNLRETIYDLAMRLKSTNLLEYLMKQSKSDQLLKPMYLHTAAASGDVEKIEFILKTDCIKLLEPDDNHNTIYHTAAAHNSANLLDYFLAKDDDFTELRNKDGETPLHVAVKKGNLESVKVLLDKNARVDIRDERNQNALHAGVASAATNVEIIALLVQRVKETYVTILNEQDKDGNTALHLAARFCRVDLFETLLDLDPEIGNTDGETALHMAVKFGTAREVRSVLKLFYRSRQINIDKKDKEGHAALFRSAELGDVDKFELLMGHGADITLTNFKGMTLLHRMVECNRKNLACSDRYIGVYYSIVKWSVKWYCYREGLRCPPENSNENYERRLTAVRYLTSEIFYNECNVLQYASKLGTGDLLKAILRTPGVYKFNYDTPFDMKNSDTPRSSLTNSNKRRILADFLNKADRPNNLVLYDVTYLIPRNKPNQADMCILEIDAKTGVKAVGNEVPKPKNIVSCLEYIVKTKDENYINNILDDEPFKFLVAKYWTLCRRGYEVLMWIHVIYMILFTYFVMPTSDFLKYRFHELSNTTDPDLTSKRFKSVSPYIPFLIWPMLILFYEMVLCAHLVSSLQRQSFSLKLGIFGQLKIGEITSGLMRIPVGIMLFVFDNLSHISSVALGFSTLGWYVMAVYSNNPHDYLECLSVVLIFGWLHTINFVKGFKDWNALASILKQILIKDITCFIYIYIFVLISFGYAVHVLLQGDDNLNPDYRQSTNTIYLTFYRMLSPSGNILDVSEDKDYANSGGRIGVLRAVCTAYSVLSTVVLMNLLIAMMNSTYSEIKSNKSTAWRIESLRIALWFERNAPCLDKLNFLGFRTELDEEQNCWYLEHATLVTCDEVFWDSNTKSKKSEREAPTESAVEIEKKENCQKCEALELLTSNMKSMSSQLALLSEKVLESQDGNCQMIKSLISDLKMEMSSQMTSINKKITESEDENRQMNKAVSDLRMEIKQIHELSLGKVQAGKTK